MEEQQDQEQFRDIMDAEQLNISQDQTQNAKLRDWLIKAYPQIQEIASKKFINEIKQIAVDDISFLSRLFDRYKSYAGTIPKEKKRKRNIQIQQCQLDNQDQFPLVIIRGIRVEQGKAKQIFIFIKAIPTKGRIQPSLFSIRGEEPMDSKISSLFINIDNINVQIKYLIVLKKGQGSDKQYKIFETLKITHETPEIKVPKDGVRTRSNINNIGLDYKEINLEDKRKRPIQQKKGRVICRFEAMKKVDAMKNCCVRKRPKKLGLYQDDFQQSQIEKRQGIRMVGKRKSSKKEKVQQPSEERKMIGSLLQLIDKVKQKREIDETMGDEFPVIWRLQSQVKNENDFSKIIKQNIKRKSIQIKEDAELILNLRNFDWISCETFLCKLVVNDPLRYFDKTNFDRLQELILSQIQMVTIEPIGKIQMPILKKINFRSNYITNITPLINLNTSEIEQIYLDNNNSLNEIGVLTQVDWPKLKNFSCLKLDPGKCLRTISYRKMMKMKMKIRESSMLFWIIKNLQQIQRLFEYNLFDHLECHLMDSKFNDAVQ